MTSYGSLPSNHRRHHDPAKTYYVRSCADCKLDTQQNRRQSGRRAENPDPLLQRLQPRAGHAVRALAEPERRLQRPPQPRRNAPTDTRLPGGPPLPTACITRQGMKHSIHGKETEQPYILNFPAYGGAILRGAPKPSIVHDRPERTAITLPASCPTAGPWAETAYTAPSFFRPP